MMSNIEAEQSLLGAILTNNDALFHVPEITPECFAEPLHGRIFSAICEIIERGGKANPLTLKARFEHDSALADIGGAVYLNKLVAWAVSVIDIKDYANQIRDLAAKRKIIEACTQAIANAEHGQATAGEISSQLAESLDNSNGSFSRYKIQWEKEISEEIYEDVKNRKTIPRYSTGIDALDKAMGGGIFAGKLYGIMARKKMGKTMLSGTISTNLQHSGVKHMFLALEMGKREIHQRNLAREANVFESAFRSDFSESDFMLKRLAEYTVNAKNDRMFIDAPGLSFRDLRHLVPIMIRKHKFTGFILDSISLVKGQSSGQSLASHYDEVADWLAETCKKYQVWCIVTAQENQQENTRGGEGIRLACDQLYRLCKSDVGSTQAWLEMMETRYTGWCGVGEEGRPALALSEKFTHFEQI